MKRVFVLSPVCGSVVSGASAQFGIDPKEAPPDAQAQKSYAEAVEWLKHRDFPPAMGAVKKADQQDGGHCVGCQKQLIMIGLQTGDYKAADQAAQEMIATAKNPAALAAAHDHRGLVLVREAREKNKPELFAEADKEYKAALAANPNFPEAVYADALALAYLREDDSAKARFDDFVSMTKGNSAIRQRAQLYAEKPEMVRARMAPAFEIKTLDGERVSLDDLQGKVVLLDFWATWCGPCREARPHIQRITQKFQCEPLVV